MWGATRIPSKVYQALYPLKKHFRCAQARHFLVCCWLVMALMRDPGKGTLKGLHAYLPSTLKYWTTLRMLRSGQWDAAAVVCDLATATLRTLPPPADGVLYLIGDSTLKDKRGRKHPLGHTTRHSEHDPYTFGFEMVLLIVSWGRYRVPVALATIDPHIKGHQNILFRQMLKDFVPPAWTRQVVVVAEAGFAANETLRLITEHKYTYVFAMPRTRKFTNGKHRRDLVQHLPKSCYYRRASHTPDGRRRDYWVFTRRATLHKLGDVTIVLSKKRRNDGPKKVKSIVTNLMEAHAGAILSMYAWRWGVEVTIKELKSGLHLGQMQVTNDKERVTRSVSLAVLAYLLLVCMYGREEAAANPHSAPRKLPIQRIFLMAFWPRRSHNSRRSEVPKQPQAAHGLCRSELCLIYRPRSKCTPSSICPLPKPMPTNWASSASSIIMFLQRWTWTRAPSCWVLCWIR